MSERIPLYFGEQCPPPPPPPLPPLNLTSRYGATTAIPLPSQQSIRPLGSHPSQHSYSYRHALNVPGLPKGESLVTSLHPPVQIGSTRLQKSNGDGNPITKYIKNLANKPNESNFAACIPIQGSTSENPKSKNTEIIKKQPVAWTCEACQCTLESEKAFKSHRKSHVKCSDCSFEGAPKVVKAHYQAKHGKFSGSGFKTITVGVPGCRVQKFKICVGNRPEDIRRWIAERRKKFPRTSLMNTQTTNSTNIAENTTEGSSSSIDSATTLKRAGKMQKQTPATTGLSSLLAGYGSSSDDDGGVDDREEETLSTTKAPKIPKREDVDVLGTNINRNEGTSASMEATNEGNAIMQTSNSSVNCTETQLEENRGKKSRPCRFYFRKGSCRNGSNCRFSHDESRFGHQFDGARNHNHQQQHRRESSLSTSSKAFRENKNTKKRKRGVHSSSDTLLRKLVQNDMERESALSIQLLKFIVDNNFFLDNDSRSRKQQN